MQPSHALCTQALPRYGVTFAHMLTYLPNPHALSIKMARQQDIKTLEYSQVVKIPESEGLLVCQCSARLGEFGSTLWVASILMYDQEFHNKKMVFFFVSLMPRGSQQGAYVYDQEFKIFFLFLNSSASIAMNIVMSIA